MMSDPCFRCMLPDCDDSSKQCLQRQLANVVDAKRRAGLADQITEEERTAYVERYTLWRLEQRAKRAETRA